MEQQPVKSKSRETKVLAFVIVVLVILYVALTAHVMRINQAIGNKQLGYSAVHTEQLQLLQQKLLGVESTLLQLKDYQDDFAALMSVRLNRLDSQALHLSNALVWAETGRENQAAQTGARFEQLDKRITEVSTGIGSVTREQSQLAGNLSTRLNELQSRLDGLSNNVAQLERQQTALLGATSSKFDQVQQQLASLAAQRQRLDQALFLSAEMDSLTGQVRQIEQVNEANLPEVAALWRRAQVAASAAAADPILAEKMNALAGEASRLQNQIANAILTVVTARHQAAANAGSPEQAAAAWLQAGEVLALFPPTNDPALAAMAQKLIAEHESIRQKLPAAQPAGQ